MSPDNPNFTPQNELPSSSRFDRALEKLSGRPESLQQLTPADINIAEIRQSLEKAGYNLEIGEAERKSLQEKQFRSLTGGRGIGVAAILGQPKAEALMELIPQLAEGRGKIGGKEGTEGRGLRQFVADTLKLITTPNPTENDIAAYCARVNERVLKGYRKAKEFRNDTDQALITQSFALVEDKTDIGEFSSIPPSSLDRLWAFILNR